MYLGAQREYLFSTHPECFSHNIFVTTPIYSSLGGDLTGLGAQGHQWILHENMGHWHSFILSAGEGERGSVIWSESDLAQ